MKSSIELMIFRYALLILLTNRETVVTAEESGAQIEVSERDGRFLRGGSYSRGGSSWSRSSGGSSYNRNSSNSSWSSNRSNYNRNNGRGMSTMGRVFTGLALAGIGIGIAAMLLPALGIGAACSPCLAFLCCGAGAAVGASAAGGARTNYHGRSDPHGYHAYNEDNRGVGGSGSRHNFGQFEARVQQAKYDVGRMPNIGGQGQPFSGPYYAAFVDPESGVTHNAVVSLFFSPQREGLSISGQGSDIDGNTIVEEGYANRDGTAWWRERTITGDIGLQVLSQGKFDFTTSTFTGTWFASTMSSGPYVHFQAGQVPRQSQTNKPTNFTAQANSPVVVQGTVISGTPGSNAPMVVQGTVL